MSNPCDYGMCQEDNCNEVDCGMPVKTEIEKSCSKCGGTYYINDGPSCLECYGEHEGTGCGSDGCPAFGIPTENRCRCPRNHASLEEIDWNATDRDSEQPVSIMNKEDDLPY